MPATWIKIADIDDGMVLAGTIEDDMGRVLLREGQELSKSYVGRLTKMGVNEVLVDLKGDDDSDIMPSLARGAATDTRKITENRLARRFKAHVDNKIMCIIHAVARRKLMEYRG